MNDKNKMTPQQIRLVIAKTHGLEPFRLEDGWFFQAVNKGSPSDNIPDEYYDVPLPEWTGDLNDAWGLVEEARESDMRLVLNDTLVGYRAAFIDMRYRSITSEFSMPSPDIWAWEDTAPLAISKAYLLWKDNKDQSK